jgi:hypothetical protein
MRENPGRRSAPRIVLAITVVIGLAAWMAPPRMAAQLPQRQSLPGRGRSSSYAELTARGTSYSRVGDVYRRLTPNSSRTNPQDGRGSRDVTLGVGSWELSASYQTNRTASSAC